MLSLTLPVDSFSVVALIATFLLISLGLHFSFGFLNIVNLVHGEFILIGAYTAFQIQDWFGSSLLGIVVAPLVAALIGALAEFVLIRRLYMRPLDTLLVTFGLSLVIRQGIQLTYTANPKQVDDPISKSITALGINIPLWRLVIVVVALSLVAIWLLLNQSTLGVRWRAVVANPELAETMGISSNRVRTSLFAVGSGIAGLSGALLTPINTLSPQFGLRFLINSFLVVILGRPGSIKGMLIASCVLGGSLGILQFHVSTVYAQMIVLLVAIIATRLRPLLQKI
jgi:branched-chain amino acid transport system permease protein/urea transport system permease protein